MRNSAFLALGVGLLILQGNLFRLAERVHAFTAAALPTSGEGGAR